jgi:glutaredoxin
MVKVIIVTTKTCPYCPPAKNLWRELKKEHNFEYEEVDASTPEGQKLAKKFNIRSVPTTIIDDRIAFIGVPPKEKAIEAVKGD